MTGAALVWNRSGDSVPRVLKALELPRDWQFGFADVVSGHVVRHEPEAWRQRPGTATHLGSRELPDGLGLAAQDAARNGAPRT